MIEQLTSKIVITGIGVISPYGVGLDALWHSLLAGQSGLKLLTTFDTSHVQCRIGGQLQDFHPETYLSPRLTRKIDRFSVFALITTQLALEHAGLLSEKKTAWSQQEHAGERVGICVGNNLGGWEFAERELRNLWSLGPREISPYMATAWFPAAVQGNVSIHFGLKGPGRTFLNDRASSALALIHAANALRRGKADIMIAGGTEAPFSPYAALCYQQSGLMSQQALDEPSLAYRPFDAGHAGLVAAEGAAFFVLERAEDAFRRGVPALVELAGWATTYDGYDVVQAAPDGLRFAAAMRQALQKAHLDAAEVDCLFSAGSAVPAEDVSETLAIHQAFGEVARTLPVSTPKSAFGNLFGAATAVDTAIALQAMQQRMIPATLHFAQSASGCDLDYVPLTPRPVSHFNACLINARGMGGTNASLVLRRPA